MFSPPLQMKYSNWQEMCYAYIEIYFNSMQGRDSDKHIHNN